jgi:hypothetical protein
VTDITQSAKPSPTPQSSSTTKNSNWSLEEVIQSKSSLSYLLVLFPSPLLSFPSFILSFLPSNPFASLIHFFPKSSCHRLPSLSSPRTKIQVEKEKRLRQTKSDTSHSLGKIQTTSSRRCPQSLRSETVSSSRSNVAREVCSLDFRPHLDEGLQGKQNISSCLKFMRDAALCCLLCLPSTI